MFRTEPYNDMGPVGEVPRWEAFGPFHDYLSGVFPLVYVLSPMRLATWAQSSQILDVFD